MNLLLYDLKKNISDSFILKDTEPSKLEEMLLEQQDLQLIYKAPIFFERNPEYLGN
ncbi:hypothetical protein [Belliella pelovolcani]|uniref:hypothetical protein n=1 Tax=Belliella pelovolcani TaxID=529505 RepID=UPI00391C19B1